MWCRHARVGEEVVAEHGEVATGHQGRLGQRGGRGQVRCQCPGLVQRERRERRQRCGLIGGQAGGIEQGGGRADGGWLSGGGVVVRAVGRRRAGVVLASRLGRKLVQEDRGGGQTWMPRATATWRSLP